MQNIYIQCIYICSLRYLFYHIIVLFNHTLFPLRQSSLHNLLDIILDLIFIFKEKKRHTEICFLHSQESNVV